MQKIFKILTREQWAEARTSGSFAGSPDDLRDGFIHLSTADQLAGTLDRHFAGQTDILVAEVDLESLGEFVKWEPSRNDQLFPHLYSALPLTAIRETRRVEDSDRLENS
jgi:beta-hydroxylase